MIELKREDRIGGVPQKKRVNIFGNLGLVAFLIVCALVAMPYFDAVAWVDWGRRGFVTMFHGGAADSEFATVYSQLGLAPFSVGLAQQGDILPHLRSLSSAPCDQSAMSKLADSLDLAGYRRDEADALLQFDRFCRGDDFQYRAADILFGLGDYRAARVISDQLMKRTPSNPQLHYLRGQILQKMHLYQESLEDFITAVELADDPKSITSDLFYDTADVYANLGHFCEAMTAIQNWIIFSPVERDTASTRETIDHYSSRGNCAKTYAVGSERFTRIGGNVIRLQARINGVNGIFILDTGASFVSLTPAFANRAKVSLQNASEIQVDTANGSTRAKVAVADTVQIGHVSADNVSVIVSSVNKFGGEIDGLLGMSFLARFDVSIGSREWTIGPKTKRGQ